MVWLFSMISFAVLVSARRSSNDKVFNYSNWTALQFTATTGILIWLFTWLLGAIEIIESNSQIDLSNNKKLQTSLRATNLFCLLLAYTAAIASASIGADCNYHEMYSNLDLYDDTIQNEAEDFCAKVQVSCAFMWFVLAGLFAVCAAQFMLNYEGKEFKFLGEEGHPEASNPLAGEHGRGNDPIDAHEDKIPAGVDL